MRDFKNLKVWKKAQVLTLGIYRCTRGFPRSEFYGLVPQMRRSAVSIPANIAEGYGQRGDGELGNFLSVALGSAAELEYHILLALELQILQTADHDALRGQVGEVQRMLVALQDRVRKGRVRKT